ncbi:hypothetical protein [Nocardioides convexus]|uniref:hypothetical protein n=1 Tax=Nocardioides convexus TaxID=2712224 RepID=UPI0024185AA6|nr:hypothetical protein [Nocardioides convexus]
MQCNFKPMFDKGTVGCGEGTVTKNLWFEGFESGLPATWTKDVEAENAHFDPTVTTKLPLVTEGGTVHKGGSSVLYFDDKGDDGNFGSLQRRRRGLLLAGRRDHPDADGARG